MPATPDFAFPFEHAQKTSLQNPTVVSQGLSKREYFVAMALQGYLSNPQTSLTAFSDEQRQALVQTLTMIADDLVYTLGSVGEMDYPA